MSAVDTCCITVLNCCKILRGNIQINAKTVSTTASVLVCAVKFVNSLTRCQHQFDIVATLIDVESNILSYPAPLSLSQFHPKYNYLIFSWQ